MGRTAAPAVPARRLAGRDRVERSAQGVSLSPVRVYQTVNPFAGALQRARPPAGTDSAPVRSFAIASLRL